MNIWKKLKDWFSAEDTKLIDKFRETISDNTIVEVSRVEPRIETAKVEAARKRARKPSAPTKARKTRAKKAK